ncbi:hypothetical protein DIS24_g11398 [Lasiodiplodia hormozganensis]|uniref:R3H-associated N-terminal domain-containing protein n=1 Tax=Lasiodiplodia hormozganensis TaxID=869390 RepID=A0AA39WV21_9PEZI|nr:hypothetical protein DIS24_g11398 [Lasiodiplodia hormozganensis]
MAIPTTPAAPRVSQPPVPEAPIDIEAWTEEASEALGAIHITPPAARIAPPAAIRGTTVTLDIPLDDHVQPHAQSGENGQATAAQAVRTGYTRRQEPLRRDSLKRREALLKGKEGSRQRRRWENDRLLNNPHAQPPLPSDWEVRPQYQFHYVPYAVASYWDKELAARNAARNTKGAKPAVSKEEEAAAEALKQVRERLKKKRAARSMLEDIEREVRKFVEKWEDRARKDEQDDLIDPDSEDEQIVFVGRNGQMSDMRAAEEELRKDLMVFDSLVGDRSAAFGRWLVHSIAAYYGLETWSITTGTPAKREAYIGIKENRRKTGHRNAMRRPLPQPLWSMPKPLEPTLSSLRDLIKHAHPEAKAYSNTTTKAAKNELRTKLTKTTVLIRTNLDLLDQERDEWWKTKAQLRRQLAEAGDEEKLKKLHLINNSITAMMRDMRARLGVWVRWGLGVGEEELEVE